MKKFLRILIGTSIVTSVISLPLLSNALSKKENASVDAYSTSSLPTTIDLNDTSASNIRSYYSSLNNLETSQRQGNNLLKNLKTILKNGQKYYSYDSGNAIWQIYEIADRDWDKSPASSTTYGTYNSSTNKITNYTYGTSSSSSKNNPYIHALYINRNVTNQTTAWDDHQQTQWGINREHVWPKAEGFETSGAGGARGDPMHLMAGNGYANNIHSNYYYGYVNTSSSYTNCGSKYSNVSGNILGKSKTLGGSTNVFEPQDCDKGDIARAIFYMVARYNYLSGSDSDGIDSNNPNLALTQSLSDWANSGYSSTTSKQGKMGIMTDLLAWHHADPVDEYEIHRNNLLYTNYTNNRNPFIDFPEWADFIWGSVNYNGSTYVSNDTSPTGYATPSSDTINGYNSGSGISVTGVTLNKNSTSILIGDTETLTATVAPSNATNKAVTWTSSNTSVATVSEGVITAKAAGNTTITVTTSDGGYTASCTVTVSNPSKTLSSISVSGQTTTFNKNDTFVFGGTVTATYSSGSPVDVTNDSSTTFSGYDMSVAGQQTVTVSYTYAGTTKTTTYTITVGNASEDTEEGSVTAASGALSGWTSSGTGSAYADGSVKFDSAGDNVYKLDIFTGDVSSNMTTLEVTINGKINGTPTDANKYKVEALDSDGNVLATDEQTGVSVVTTSYGDTTFTLDSNLSGCTGIRITYVTKGGGNWGIKSVSWVATYSLVPAEVTLSSIAVKTAPTKLNYYTGEDFSPAGLVITATYSDSSTSDIPYADNEDSFEFDPYDDLQTTDVSITISYGGKTTTQAITVTAKATSITATVSKTYYVGETISKSDITVEDNLGNTITDFSFANNEYQFTYSDAASGGSLTNKVFTNAITYDDLSCSLTVSVQRKARVTPSSVKDTITATGIGVSGNSYAAYSNKSFTSSAVYYAYCFKDSSSNLQLRTSDSKSGVVSTSSGGTIQSVTINVGSGTKTVQVYAKNTAYSSPSDLYSSDSSTKGTLIDSTSTTKTITFTGSYTYVGIKSSSGAIYLSSIEVTYGSADSAVNLANYIMYEDTTDQCESKFTVAKGYFEGLTSTERDAFMIGTSYVVATARERLIAWATHEGKSIVSNNNDYVIQANKGVQILGTTQNSTTVIISVLFGTITIGSFVGYNFLKKRKED